MPKPLWPLVALVLSPLAALRAQPVQTPVFTDNQVFTSFALPGGFSADLILTFDEASNLAGNLIIEAELPTLDSDFLARLPADVFIPDDFPVLVRFTPRGQIGFRRNWTLELRTENLRFEANTPLRLFKAPDGGAFEDVSNSIGVGSFRASASLGAFSELVIAGDLRALARRLESKLDRLEVLLADNAAAIDDAVEAGLNDELQAARDAVAKGDFATARQEVQELLDLLLEQAGVGVPEGGSVQEASLAGEIESAALSLRLCLILATTAGESAAETRTLGLPDGSELEVTVTLHGPFDLDLDALDISADLVSPTDTTLLARLPAGVSIPEEFPVLVQIEPDPNRAQSFRGLVSFELVTESLDVVGLTPLRLFKSDGGGPFVDVTQLTSPGSFRASANGGAFSELLIARDLRPAAAVVAAKFLRLQALLDTHKAAIAPSLFSQLQALVDQAKANAEAGLLLPAVQALKQLRAAIVQGEDDLPAVWRPASGRVNVAALLRSTARTLQYSLAIQRATVLSDDGDLNRDGKVDVQDVFLLLNRVFATP